MRLPTLSRPFNSSSLKMLSTLMLALSFVVSPFSGAIAAPFPSKPIGKLAPKAPLKIDSRCEQILQKLVNTYKSAVSLNCNIDVDMSISSKSEGTKKLPAKYIVSIAKPNRYAVELDSARGGKVVSNGKRSEYYFKPENAYMIAPSEATMAAGFDKHEFRFVTAGLINFTLVRELMETNPFAALMNGVDKVQYVGAEQVTGVDCDHLRLFQGDLSSDIWVGRQAAPLLMKVQPDMNATLSAKAKADGNKISLAFIFKDQSFNKPMNDGRFEVAHTKGAKFMREFFHEEGAGLIGKKAPDVVLPMADGAKIQLSSLKDRFVILDFWATWCPPCVKSLPVFAKVAESYKSKGIVFIAVNKGEPAATAKSYLKSQKINASLAIDLNEKLGGAFKVEAIPCTIFIGKDGIVKGVHEGINPNGLEQSFKEDLEKFIAGKSLKREQ